MSDIYEEPFKAYTWDVDSADRLTMAAMFNYCQEVAGNHARELGVGTEYMRENGIVWILSRMSAVLDERPAWGARLRVRTWPRGTDRLFAVRDYEVLTEDGRRVGRGRGAWLIAETASMRPRRPEALAARLPLNEGRQALPGGGGAVASRDGLELAFSRCASYSDIDYNGHMNNARYVQWIQDALPRGLLEGAGALRLDINYLAELRPGAGASVLAGPVEGDADWPLRYAIEGRNDEGKAAFRAELGLGKGPAA